MPTASGPAPVLLDTHAWIWLFDGDERLSPRARQAIEQAARDASVLVSAISAWEVGLLERKGRIRLEKDAIEWARETLSKPGMRLAQLTPEIAIASSRLPGNFVGDPADRILVASARALEARLVTQDRAILEYGKTGRVRVLAATGPDASG